MMTLESDTRRFFLGGVALGSEADAPEAASSKTDAFGSALPDARAAERALLRARAAGAAAGALAAEAEAF
ncbi:hypothetical protein [Adlercreutzia sp. ZJ141]|uniref:hypothetical protein n=1 Tax=Adlercreutzia sp. ZJ141 TaxID=2709406 RepID=UPI0013ECFD5C|nr:hypothetical protein [Adlercreutzia sp. ZJ141]